MGNALETGSYGSNPGWYIAPGLIYQISYTTVYIIYRINIPVEGIGRAVARRPWWSILGSLVLVMACGGGYAMLESETRAEKQCVP